MTVGKVEVGTIIHAPDNKIGAALAAVNIKVGALAGLVNPADYRVTTATIATAPDLIRGIVCRPEVTDSGDNSAVEVTAGKPAILMMAGTIALKAAETIPPVTAKVMYFQASTGFSTVVYNGAAGDYRFEASTFNSIKSGEVGVFYVSELIGINV